MRRAGQSAAATAASPSRIAGLVVGGMVGLAFAVGAALPPVLPGDRLWRHDAARGRGARRRSASAWSPSASMPTPPAPTCPGASSPLVPSSAACASARSIVAFYRATQPSASRDYRHGDLQRDAGSRPAPISTRSPASASTSSAWRPGESRRHAGVVLRRSGDAERPKLRDFAPSPCPTPSSASPTTGGKRSDHALACPRLASATGQRTDVTATTRQPPGQGDRSRQPEHMAHAHGTRRAKHPYHLVDPEPVADRRLVSALLLAPGGVTVHAPGSVRQGLEKFFTDSGPGTSLSASSPCSPPWPSGGAT